MDTYLANIPTEQPNKASENIDQCSTQEILRIINDEDQKVAPAVREEIPHIAKAVDLVVERLNLGGHLFYFGAGTSGRLGVLDASECPPTYGVAPSLVQGYIAGGDRALRTSAEGCEDDPMQGRREIELHDITGKDAVVGISASGRAPYVIGVLDAAHEAGAVTIGIATNRNSILEQHCDICIAPEIGNEVVTGSTRMKSGTAQKLVLNMISTAAMIRMGKVYGNLMVDVRATNDKLRDRAVRIFRQVTGADEDKARYHLEAADMDTKLAILMYMTGQSREAAERTLEEHGGFLREALQSQTQRAKGRRI